MNSIAYSACLLLVAVVSTTFACNGFQLKVNKVESCDPNSVMTFSKDFDAKLVEQDGKCLIIPTGCVSLSKAVSAAKVSYDVKKDGFPLKGSSDGCKAMKKNDSTTMAVFQMFGLEGKCPMKAGETCNKDGKSIDLTKHKGKLGMAAGKIIGTIKIDHKDDGKTCFKFDITIKKQR